MTTESKSAREVVVDREPRCWRCRKKLANYLGRPWDMDCTRCKAKNAREIDSPQASGTLSTTTKRFVAFVPSA